MARVEDESVHYVLPNHTMLKIITELPREMKGILACCNPVPLLVKRNLGALHSILLAVRDKQLLTVDPALMSSPPQSELADFTSNLLQSPLDLSHLEDSGDLDIVVKNKFTFANNNIVKSKPDLSVFHTISKPVTRSSLVHFVSPFLRFTLLKPYLDSLEKSQEEVEGVTNSENIRMDSIEKHFEKLTETTPKRVVKKAVYKVSTCLFQGSMDFIPNSTIFLPGVTSHKVLSDPLLRILLITTTGIPFVPLLSTELASNTAMQTLYKQSNMEVIRIEVSEELTPNPKFLSTEYKSRVTQYKLYYSQDGPSSTDQFAKLLHRLMLVPFLHYDSAGFSQADTE